MKSTSASPTASAAAPVVHHYVVKLSISKEFVTNGSTVTLAGTVTDNGVLAPDVPVALTEKYSDGKVVPLGTFDTDASGRFSHPDKPIYIGTITAVAGGVKSNSVPSRVIITYRRTTVTMSGTTITLTTSTHPGFITGTNRQERVQLLLTNAEGRQLKVLKLVNAGARQSAPAEAQGINPITFANVNLGRHGTFYLVVKVLGTPVNTGAASKPIKVTV